MSSLANWRIGFIGLGLMGRPMARNLLAAGAEVTGYNRSRAALDEMAADGLRPAATAGAAAGSSDVVILMLPDTDAVRSVLLDADRIVDALRPGSLVIDMGTTAVPATMAFAAAVASAGCRYLDAPVSGGAVGAAEGSLSIMVGGEDAAWTRAQPVFAALGRNVNHIGPVGAGQLAKSVNQVIVGLTIGAVAEAFVLAERAGVDPARVRNALMGGFASSRILELHGRRMVEGDFTPGGRARTQRKDLAEAMALAKSLGVDLPALRLNLDLYDQMIGKGWGDLDHAALIELIRARQPD
jgi:3-hydroxyisobutyrate dehydrogenase-like beta-hydroxyacid dehydrogenase